MVSDLLVLEARALADLLGPEKEMTAVARKERRVRDH